MKKGKRIFAALLAAAMMVAGASTVMAASNTLEAASFEQGAEYYEETKMGEFTLMANADKAIRVQNPDEAQKATDGKEFTQLLKFDGGANGIKFNAKKGDKVTVYVQSGGSDERQVALYSPANVDDAGKAVAMNPQACPSTDTASVNIATFDIEADGEYYIASVSKGIRVYSITVGSAATEAPKQDSVPKTGVVSTAAICGVIALAGAGVAVVSGKKEN